MLNCNYPNCKKHKTCNLKEPVKNYNISKEIQYWLKQLKQAKKRVNEYADMLKDIQQYHKYAIPVNVYGHIMYAPKQNVFGVYIRRPEHVNYDWNLNKLERIVDELTDKIRELRLRELRGR